MRRELKAQRAQLRQLKTEEWMEELAHARAGLYAVGALRPILDQWIGRKHGSLGYRLVQVLTGHGCFGEYLHRINREESGRCHHCTSNEDSARHTLEECPAWAEERRVLRDAMGDNVSLQNMTAFMIKGEDEWRSAVSFCEQVMLQKEAAEREREEAHDAPEVKRRGGRARRQFDRVALP